MSAMESKTEPEESGQYRKEIRKGTCPVCGWGCHVNVHVRDVEIVKITGDPSSPRGKNLCEKFAGALDFHYHPDRVNYPLKRTGERGEGKWERITWERLVDEIAGKLDRIRARFGPEAVAVLGGGTSHLATALFERWCNLWGTPNHFWQGKNCGEAEFIAESAIYGYVASTGLAPTPGITKCVLVWGRNPWASDMARTWRSYMPAKKAGTKIVVIDPRLSETAREADIWLQLRPGTDGALALSMLNVIINEGLYDKEFVDKWCLGFDELRAHVQKYPPDKVEGITWVRKELIIEVARLYATSKPALLTMGVADGHIGRAVLSAVAGKSLLRAVTGNLDVAGGNTFLGNPENTAYMEEMHWDKLIAHPLRTRDNVSAHVWPIASVKALRLFREAQSKVYSRGVGVGSYYMAPGPRCVWTAILEEDPYPIKSLFLAASNPLVVLGNAKRIYEALKSPNLELLVAMERWMTPSAQMADYVIPSADSLERPELSNMTGFTNSCFARQNAVDPLYERKADYYLWRDLGRRLGQAEYWPETLELWYDRVLQPIHVSFKELAAREVPGFSPASQIKAYEKKGFATFSGKVELDSSLFKQLGYPGLPDYEEPAWSPISTPNMAKEYPLILISGSRVRMFLHSQHRQIKTLRNKRPYPLLEINPETARGLGINEGDAVYIETPLGRIWQKAKLTSGIDPRVVHADGYWWYPELPANEPGLSGVWDSNINAILPDDPEFCDYTGDNYFRALLCKVYKAE